MGAELACRVFCFLLLHHTYYFPILTFCGKCVPTISLYLSFNHGTWQVGRSKAYLSCRRLLTSHEPDFMLYYEYN
ncbi:hypothetical protein GGS20DRAFT_91364 [Poronia punctata]|nr:hypothetical protein GGS20DRAFT_91364 [Poronia punctata]